MLQNIDDIKKENFYKPWQIANLLEVHESTITRKCQSGLLKAKNIGTEKRATWRVLGKDLLDYLNN